MNEISSLFSTVKRNCFVKIKLIIYGWFSDFIGYGEFDLTTFFTQN